MKHPTSRLFKPELSRPLAVDETERHMRNVVITGAASGIGRCFAEHYLRQPSYNVIATDRQPINLARPLENGHGNDSRLITLPCDFSDEQTIKDLAERVGNIPVHLVIHSAGVRGLMPRTSKDDSTTTTPRETYEVLNQATLMQTFAINSAGVFTLLQSIMPQLQLGSSEQAPAKVVVMSSRMASISYNSTLGGAYAYRASKAALNAIVKSFSVDVPEVMFTLVHPGRVETGLVEFKEDGAMSVEESVGEMLRLIETLGREDSGKFVDRFGETIGW